MSSKCLKEAAFPLSAHSTPGSRKRKSPRAQLKHVSVSEIKKFYCATHPSPGQDSKTGPDDECPGRLCSPQIQQRWDLVQKNSQFHAPGIGQYKFFALKGILVHNILRKLIREVLPDLPEQISVPVDPVTLCFALNWHAYRETISCMHRLRNKYPQVTVFDESLVHSAIQDVHNLLGYLLAEITPLLEQGKSLGTVLARYANIRLEQNGTIRYKGFLIHYQPDWARVTPEGIYILDFKVGKLQLGQPVNERDRVQVLLYAWCLSQRFRQPVKVAIYYTQGNTLWEVDFTRSMEQEAQQIVDDFLLQQRPEYQKTRNSTQSERINTTSDLASLGGVSPSL